MKKTGGLKKIAVRLNGSAEKIYHTLAEHMDGSKKVIIAPGLTAYCLADGTIIELYGPGAEYPPYLFAEADVVVSYRVTDLDKTIIALQCQGVLLVGSVHEVHATLRYCHVRAAGQSLFGIYEEKDK